jgi:hypothetical protein
MKRGTIQTSQDSTTSSGALGQWLVI